MLFDVHGLSVYIFSCLFQLIISRAGSKAGAAQTAGAPPAPGKTKCAHVNRSVFPATGSLWFVIDIHFEAILGCANQVTAKTVHAVSTRKVREQDKEFASKVLEKARRKEQRKQSRAEQAREVCC